MPKSKFLSAEIEDLTKASEVLQARIRTLEGELDSQRKRADAFHSDALSWKEKHNQARLQFDDLKSRLAFSEFENQKMRGYIARVQEDDVVREELVEAGDPEGERQLTPKRKPTQFTEPSNFSPTGESDATFRSYNSEPSRKSKSWITY